MGAVAVTAESHWEQVYASRSPHEVSWYEAVPQVSMRLVRTALAAMTPGGSSVLDVGAGASLLVDNLVARGVPDVTVLDVSARALGLVRARLSDPSPVTLVRADVLAWSPGRVFDVWHDRAVFHFLTDPGSRSRYARVAGTAIRPGGSLVLATFAPDGPERCSGLPVCRYDQDGLAAEFDGAFELRHAELAVHVTPGGGTQPFSWVVLRRR